MWRFVIRGLVMAAGGLFLTGYWLSGSIPENAAIWQVKAAGPALVVGGLLWSWIGYRNSNQGQA
jgi:hypothetical protein